MAQLEDKINLIDYSLTDYVSEGFYKRDPNRYTYYEYEISEHRNDEKLR